jgi:hypothetical protein
MGDRDEYLSRSSGLPGVMEAWGGPGGYMVISRVDSGDLGDIVKIAITPDSANSHGLIWTLGTQ